MPILIPCYTDVRASLIFQGSGRLISLLCHKQINNPGWPLLRTWLSKACWIVSGILGVFALLCALAVICALIWGDNRESGSDIGFLYLFIEHDSQSRSKWHSKFGLGSGLPDSKISYTLNHKIFLIVLQFFIPFWGSTAVSVQFITIWLLP